MRDGRDSLPEMEPTAVQAEPIHHICLVEQYQAEKTDLLACIETVFQSGQFVGGAFVERFETAIAEFVGTKHCVAVNSGTDALILAMKALDIGPGDEVITPPNSFVASTSAIIQVGATAVFADVRDDQNIDPDAVEAAVTSRTKAIMPVHLTGRIADMTALTAIADRHGLAVIEDAAQAMGARYDGKAAGSLGHIGCFSAHPVKTLNAAGDAGFLTLNDDALARKLRMLRHHGMSDRDTVVEWGMVSRMDNLQAAILCMRLEKLQSVVEIRRHNAATYHRILDRRHIFAAPCRTLEYNAFHTFVIQCEQRDPLQKYLRANNIGTAIHYPVPLHLQPAALGLGYQRGSFPMAEAQAERVLSIPVHQFLSELDVKTVAQTINRFLF